MKPNDELKFLTLDVIVPTFNRADLIVDDDEEIHHQCYIRIK